MKPLQKISAHSDSVNDDTVTLMRCYKEEGDYVESETILGEYETSKALVDFSSETNGCVHWLIKEGEEVQLGDPVCEIYEKKDYETLFNNNIQSGSQATEEKNEPEKERLRIVSEKAAKLIEVNNVDINTINASIVTSRVVNERMGKKEVPKPNEEKQAQLIGFSKTKKNEIKFLSSVNSTGLVSRINSSFEFRRSVLPDFQSFIHSTPSPLLVFEISKLLSVYQDLNNHVSEGELTSAEHISIGLAMDDGVNGLKVVVVHDADKLTLPQIEEQIFELSSKYETANLDVKDIEGATFTISDLSQMGISGFHPLVNFKNSAILGVSGDENRLVLDLSFDHRVSNGREATLFLKELERRLTARDTKLPSSGKLKVVECSKCFKKSDEDPDEYFVPIINQKGEGYLCSVCLAGW
ncbi:2-oxo acid dehydrogenase subunit E2 [Akkermansiaceae bacterium]|nr:2-oxo acid dehydrogenase subunit E2 [Akkermansiaceae bacterium]